MKIHRSRSKQILFDEIKDLEKLLFFAPQIICQKLVFKVAWSLSCCTTFINVFSRVHWSSESFYKSYFYSWKCVQGIKQFKVPLSNLSTISIRESILWSRTTFFTTYTYTIARLKIFSLKSGQMWSKNKLHYLFFPRLSQNRIPSQQFSLKGHFHMLFTDGLLHYGAFTLTHYACVFCNALEVLALVVQIMISNSIKKTHVKTGSGSNKYLRILQGSKANVITSKSRQLNAEIACINIVWQHGFNV